VPTWTPRAIRVSLDQLHDEPRVLTRDFRRGSVLRFGRLRSVLRTRAASVRYDEYTIAEHFRRQGAHIGAGCRLLVTSLGAEPYLVTIGDETVVSVDVLFVTHDGGTWAFRDLEPTVNRYGRIDVGSRVFIGARAVVLPGVRIGDRSVIGAGSVVTRDVPPGVVAAGSPARVLMTLDEYRRKCQTGSLALGAVRGQSKRAALERLVPPAGRGQASTVRAREDGR
jgi:acetyltransferase-like isoleucine patch superfamily enzyme